MINEYQYCRAAGYSEVAALDAMMKWRENSIEDLLSCAERVGIPPGIYKLVVALDREVFRLNGAKKAALAHAGR